MHACVYACMCVHMRVYMCVKPCKDPNSCFTYDIHTQLHAHSLANSHANTTLTHLDEVHKRRENRQSDEHKNVIFFFEHTTILPGGDVTPHRVGDSRIHSSNIRGSEIVHSDIGSVGVTSCIEAVAQPHCHPHIRGHAESLEMRVSACG